VVRSVVDPELFCGDPHPELAWLRQNDPVHWDDAYKVWVLTRYDDVVYASKHPEIFCSRLGVRPNVTNLGANISIVTEDEPRHGLLRRLVNRGFTPRMVGRLRVVIEEIVTQTIDAVAERGECEFVQDIAVDLPLLVIADMIGIRREDRKKFHEWSDTMIAAGGGLTDPETVAKAMRSYQEYAAYLTDIFEDRRRHPREDLVSVLVAAFDEGVLQGELSLAEGGSVDNELIMFMTLLLVAGNETTRNALSGGMIALMENPEERRKVVENPDLIDPLTEEIVRWVSPVTSFARTATRDTELRDTKIREGEQILMMYPSANRDEERFPQADRFIADRTPNPHVGFGIGNHFCLGANLARLEIRMMMSELLRRIPDMQLAPGATPEYAPSTLVRTIAKVPVVFTAESSRR
jgi:cytochrome P450 family 142 subfamily A polypeptide 1